MKLINLFKDIKYTLVKGNMEEEISDIVYDSRKAKAGTLYPDEEYIYEEYRYDESEDTYYDAYGRKVLFYDESMHKR